MSSEQAPPSVEEITRIEPCESWGKHCLDIKIDGKWEHLRTDYLVVVEKMKKQIDAAVRQLADDNSILFDLRKMTLAERDAAREELAAEREGRAADRAAQRSADKSLRDCLCETQAELVKAKLEISGTRKRAVEAIENFREKNEQLEAELARLKQPNAELEPLLETVRNHWFASSITRHPTRIETTDAIRAMFNAERQKVERLEKELTRIREMSDPESDQYRVAAAALRETE